MSKLRQSWAQHEVKAWNEIWSWIKSVSKYLNKHKSTVWYRFYNKISGQGWARGQLELSVHIDIRPECQQSNENLRINLSSMN